MPRLHPTILVSSVALYTLLACEHWVIDKKREAAEGQAVEGGRAAAQQEHAGKPEGVAREALHPQPAPGAASPPPGAPLASERVPTSGTAVEDPRAAQKAAAHEPADHESADHKSSDDAASAESADRGSPSDTCVQGWIRPHPGSKLRKAALDMLREQRGERFVVIEMRYFVGPEDAEVIGPQRQVERWYVKARSLADRSRQQRWLLRRAEVGSGIDAVAPFDSKGYGPGTWRRPDAVDESTADPFQHPCDTARAGARCMGLPRAVLGCLQGT
ncbi:MAG TPA: hypothetical protein VFS67_24430 [Polyangiaceae bacterium]|jgi:hypothetical protein|nr:hypothetical protein [Polyangiaceae bacterium]